MHNKNFNGSIAILHESVYNTRNQNKMYATEGQQLNNTNTATEEENTVKEHVKIQSYSKQSRRETAVSLQLSYHWTHRDTRTRTRWNVDSCEQDADWVRVHVCVGTCVWASWRLVGGKEHLHRVVVDGVGQLRHVLASRCGYRLQHLPVNSTSNIHTASLSSRNPHSTTSRNIIACIITRLHNMQHTPHHLTIQ